MRRASFDGKRPAWATVSTVFFGVAVLLLLAELSWRVFVPMPAHEITHAQQVETILSYLRPCAVSARQGGKPLIVGARPEYTGGDFTLAPQASAGVLRLAVVGESTGAMLGGALHDIVAERVPGRVEVMNCADSGSSLGHVERRAREVLEYDPDVLLVVFGHNVMMWHPTNEWLLRAGVLLRRSRLLAELSPAFATPPEPPVLSEQLDRFETWLRQLAAASRRRGVELMVTTMAANLWFAPAVPPEVLFDERFLAAGLQHARGKRDRAIADLTRLLDARAEAYWHFTLGVWLAERGDVEDAGAHLRAAIDADELETDRRRSTVNEIIRRVAAEENLLLRDTDKEIEASARPGLPGWQMFSDHCHLQPTYLHNEAAAVLRTTLGERLPEPRDGQTNLRPLSIHGSLIGLVQVQASRDLFGAWRFLRSITSLVEHWLRYDADLVEREVDAFVSGTVFASLESAERRGEVLASIAQGFWRAGKLDEAMALNRRARQEGGAGAWIQLGLFQLERADESEARRAFERALTIAPRPDAAFYLTHLDDPS